MYTYSDASEVHGSKSRNKHRVNQVYSYLIIRTVYTKP
jgi:hypothetical protein